jgi:hypothetical protein
MRGSCAAQQYPLVLHLFRAIIREAKQMPTANRRDFIIRKVGSVPPGLFLGAGVASTCCAAFNAAGRRLGCLNWIYVP